MDARTDTSSSGIHRGQWAFLSSPTQHGTGSQTRSLPPTSSYLRSDPSSLSPLPAGLPFQLLNASRSSLPRNIYNPSAGGYSATTNPSQPVLIRIHSDVASNHLHPPRRPPRRRSFKDMSKLPPITEYSFESIWSTVQGDVQDDINAIAEIWGQHRLVLADQHESHLPPLGEITATGAELQTEPGNLNETPQFPTEDHILIADQDASLAEGSNAGSAAYGLLERLQAIPRTRPGDNNIHDGPSVTSRLRRMPARNLSSPAILTDIPITTTISIDTIPEQPPSPTVDSRRASRNLLQTEAPASGTDARPSRLTGAVVSEVYLSAGANGRVVSDPPIVSEAGRHYPLYSYDESAVFEGDGSTVRQTKQLSFRERMRRLTLLRDLGIGLGWRSRAGGRVAGSASGDASNAETHLRGILGREDMERERQRLRSRQDGDRPAGGGRENG